MHSVDFEIRTSESNVTTWSEKHFGSSDSRAFKLYGRKLHFPAKACLSMVRRIEPSSFVLLCE